MRARLRVRFRPAICAATAVRYASDAVARDSMFIGSTVTFALAIDRSEEGEPWSGELRLYQVN